LSELPTRTVWSFYRYKSCSEFCFKSAAACIEVTATSMKRKSWPQASAQVTHTATSPTLLFTKDSFHSLETRRVTLPSFFRSVSYNSAPQL